MRNVLAIQLEQFRGFWFPVSWAVVSSDMVESLPDATGQVLYDEGSFRAIPGVAEDQDFATYEPDLNRLSDTHHYNRDAECWEPIPDVVDWGLEVTYLTHHRMRIRYRTYENTYPEFGVRASWCTDSGATEPAFLQGHDIVIDVPPYAQMLYLVLNGDTAGTIYQVESWYPKAEIVEETCSTNT